MIGLRGKDGVVFAVEKLVTSKLYEPGANKRIFHVDEHVGMVSNFIIVKSSTLFKDVLISYTTHTAIYVATYWLNMIFIS